MDEQLAFTPASELRSLIASKQISPLELTKLYFDRIDKLDSQLNAYLALDRDAAIASAKAAEKAVIRNDHLGLLHGVPISIKDLELTKGIHSTSGSMVFKNRVPDEDSIVVERVRNSGAIILGKTNTPEFGLLGATENLLTDHCRNPWNVERTTGGSSGGAGGALVAGLCAIATGSDGGGSIRIPASFCGTYGIKPTQGRVPRYGGSLAPVLANQTSQSGPMSRTVLDSAILLQILAGHDHRDPSCLRTEPPNFIAAVEKDITGLRIAWSKDFGYASVEPEVIDACSKAANLFQDLGCIVEEPEFVLDAPYDPFITIFSTNAFAAYGTLLETHYDELSWYARECIEHGASQTGADYARAIGQLDRMKAQMATLFESYDLLLSPTMPVTAFPVGEYPTQIGGKEPYPNPEWGFIPFTHPINSVGNTAASIPCGFSKDGMPIGLHIVGRKGDEETVLAASSAFEKILPWADRRPPIS